MDSGYVWGFIPPGVVSESASATAHKTDALASSAAQTVLSFAPPWKSSAIAKYNLSANDHDDDDVCTMKPIRMKNMFLREGNTNAKHD